MSENPARRIADPPDSMRPEDAMAAPPLGGKREAMSARSDDRPPRPIGKSAVRALLISEPVLVIRCAFAVAVGVVVAILGQSPLAFVGGTLLIFLGIVRLIVAAGSLRRAPTGTHRRAAQRGQRPSGPVER
jgi:hypothetical protein